MLNEDVEKAIKRELRNIGSIISLANTRTDKRLKKINKLFKKIDKLKEENAIDIMYMKIHSERADELLSMLGEQKPSNTF